MTELTREQAQRFATVDYDNTFALVATAGEGSQEKIIAVARYYRMPRQDRAEVAFVVEDAYQGRGIGNHLIEHLAEVARERYAASGLPRLATLRLEPRLLYNPGLRSRRFMVPGTAASILLIITTIVTAMGLAREREMGTMEQLLVTPISPLTLMVGKIVPYIMIGLIQVTIVIGAALLLFGVPLLGSVPLLYLCVLLFIAANLTLGITFSSIARNQLQAMQMMIFFFMPSIILSGFMFPYRGMPEWAQWIGSVLPLTHFLVLVRGIMLKGASLMELWPQIWPILAFMLAVIAVGLLVYRRTLD